MAVCFTRGKNPESVSELDITACLTRGLKQEVCPMPRSRQMHLEVDIGVCLKLGSPCQ